MKGFNVIFLVIIINIIAYYVPGFEYIKVLTSLNIHNNSMKSGQFSHFQNEKETNPER